MEREDPPAVAAAAVHVWLDGVPALAQFTRCHRCFLTVFTEDAANHAAWHRREQI